MTQSQKDQRYRKALKAARADAEKSCVKLYWKLMRKWKKKIGSDEAHDAILHGASLAQDKVWK